MATLERYRKCFEACGIALPVGRFWRQRGNETWIVFGGSSDLFETECLCVCRCAAEDWLRQRCDLSSFELSGNLGGVMHTSAIWRSGTPGDAKITKGADEHMAIINLCYAVAGKEEVA